jgi:hypothetical protein
MDNNIGMFFIIRGCYDNLSYYVWAKPEAYILGTIWMIKPFFWAAIVGKRRGFCLNSSTLRKKELPTLHSIVFFV